MPLAKTDSTSETPRIMPRTLEIQTPLLSSNSRQSGSENMSVVEHLPICFEGTYVSGVYAGASGVCAEDCTDVPYAVGFGSLSQIPPTTSPWGVAPHSNDLLGNVALEAGHPKN